MKKDKIREFIESYEDHLTKCFDELWDNIQIEYDKLEAYSVIGALLSRQVTLSIQMARSPGILNGHSAPLFLRAMTDLHIALSWIMLDLQDRSKKYILHGLGEEKLLIEHYKKELEDNPDIHDKESLEAMIDLKSRWINSQRRDFMVEVNLGNWAQLDYRKMSQEAGCESLYKFSYKPWSHAAHNMWPHVSIYNSKECSNPLHKHHMIPELFEAPTEIDFLYRSCKYVDMAFDLFKEKFDISLEAMDPLEWWYDYFSEKGSGSDAQSDET